MRIRGANTETYLYRLELVFSKILIANRGEIACRVIRTARKMGIQTVAVYSDADAGALHVTAADEAVRIGPAAAAQSYLSVEAIISACRETGAEAVHPGYGFLSEDTKFCQALTDANIAFIGPGAEAITLMGDKITSKKLARDAGVNVIPGYDDVIRDGSHAIELAQKIGYPVMLKPTAAGGGKGMRLAYDDEQCAEGFERSRSEAKTHFGDDRVFVEKFIEDPRHIEIQVLADTHGHCIHLGERECSLQRRHQKVIEEAPSPFLDSSTRKRIADQAVLLAKAVDYVSAGTVEFVVDRNQDFYFLEMNTRLQVEHPVTEMTTGLDLVEWMIRIAAGEMLSLSQADIQVNGWSVESRIYAEDAARNFLPSTGRLTRYAPPESTDNIRVDTGVYEGAEISIHYDPIIAKLITFGETRKSAFEHMAYALANYQISGVTSNIPFLQSLAQNPAVLDGQMTTLFIEREYPEGYDWETAPRPEKVLEHTVLAAAILHCSYEERASTIEGQMRKRPWPVATDWMALIDSEQHQVSIERVACGHSIQIGDTTHVVNHSWHPGKRIFEATISDDSIIMQVKRLGIVYQIDYCGYRSLVKVFTPQAAKFNEHMIEQESMANSPLMTSPMPGLLVELHITEGQSVKSGETVAVVEAMKMQNVLRAQRDGVVVKVLASAGDSLAADQPILEFE